jgi:hypothetical protein
MKAPPLIFWYCSKTFDEQHYYKMWVQFIGPRSLDQWIHYFPTKFCSLWPMNSLNIQWNHLTYMNIFYYNEECFEVVLLCVDGWCKSYWILNYCHLKFNKIKTKCFIEIGVNFWYCWKVLNEKDFMEVICKF